MEKEFVAGSFSMPETRVSEFGGGKCLLSIVGFEKDDRDLLYDAKCLDMITILLSRDYLLSPGRERIMYADHFSLAQLFRVVFSYGEFFAFGGEPAKSSFFSANINTPLESRSLGVTDEMACFPFDGQRQLMTLPSRRLIFPYEAVPSFPFEETSFGYTVDTQEIASIAIKLKEAHRGRLRYNRMFGMPEYVSEKFESYEVDTNLRSL